METGKRFEQWAVLEIMGHNRFAGLVSEETIAGSSFIRIDIPAVEKVEPHTKFFSPSSVYAITPTTEEIATNVAKSLRSAPLTLWDFPEEIRERMRTPALTAPRGDDDFDDANDDDADDYDEN